MDQIKIGKFIAEIRKENNLTQRQLAEELNISDKTVSKWECGKGLPEVSVMLPLCETLKITVNELLSGERISAENYQQKAEENMMNLVKEKEENKKKIAISVIVAALCVSVLTVCILIAGYVENMGLPVRIMLIGFGVVVVIVGIGIAVVLDREAGTYECPSCDTRFVPDMTAYIMGPHTLTKRRLKCPNCGQVHYCRKRLTR